MTKEIVNECDSEKLKKENHAKAAVEYKEKIIQKAKEQVDLWNKTGLLQGDEYVVGQMAILLENQRLFNEISTDSGDMEQFKRISIPLVRRVFDPTYCLIWHLTSLQAMIGPKAFAYFNRPDGEVFEEIDAKTKRIKSFWEFPTHDYEADMTAILSAEICDEINQEVITDLRNNVGIHEELSWQGPEALWSFLTGLFYRFETETGPNKEVPFGKKPNWIVTNKLLAAEIKKVVDFEKCLETIKPIVGAEWHDKLKCVYTGIINKEIKLIECDNLLHNDILVGFKEGTYGSGYVYMPYVPFTRTPIMLDPETFNPRAGILTRYTKRLSNNGSDFYACLTVKGHEPIIVKAEQEFVAPLDIGENVDKSE